MSAEDWNVKDMTREELESELETRRGEYEATSLALAEAGVPEMVDVANGSQWRALAKRVRELTAQRDRDRQQHDCGNKVSGAECALMCKENADGGGICFRCYLEREIADFKDVERALGDTCDKYLVSFGQVASYIDEMRARYERQLEVGTPAYVSEVRAGYERSLAETENERDEARDGVDTHRQVLTSLVNAVEDAMATPTEAASWAASGDMRGYLAPAIELVNWRPVFGVWVVETHAWGSSHHWLDGASACPRQEAEEKMTGAIADRKESNAVATTLEVRQRWPWDGKTERAAVGVSAGGTSEYTPTTEEVCGARNDLNDRRCARTPHEKGTMHASEGMSWFDQHVPQEKYGGKSLAQWLRGDRT